MIQATARSPQGQNPQRVPHRPCGARLSEIGGHARRVTYVQLPKQMDQHQCALAFEKIAANFLAVTTFVTNEAEQIILNLKCRTKETPEAVESIQVDVILRRDKRP